MRHTRRHLLIGGVVLVLVWALVPLPGQGVVARLLLGWVVGSLAFSIPVLVRCHRADAAATRKHLEGLEGGRTETDVVVVTAAVASLGAVGVMLLAGRGGGGESALAVAAVASSWLAVHTVYALRYARHWFLDEPGCVDFPGSDHPRMSDFVYLSFTLGMTYQVSDTDLRTSAVRSLVLRHTLLSYVLGTVVVAATINLVVSLAS
ncbi:MAG: DUF1345 domain-containing protein [Micrococcales bacterium]|uniref:DUF1345 domain-containing protein n=1 Tax=Phycicoccus sp. TaxID=1902410 RepID=UPI0019AD70AA|nr:DUF1345 domain-containing protein [Phycicoccus sp.]MBD3783910.1 DUF1345 domain-containing protein [Micrococcales bacterium]HMM95028.1 DUF1345 domain-containing protein [Phycicoccus sp.]